MKASEFMVGDFAYCEGKVIKMEQISPDCKQYLSDGKLYTYVYNDGIYEPIPLTEKLLTLIGFEYDEQMNAMIFRFDRGETYIHIEYVFGINRIRVSVDPYRCGYAIDTEIHYVHELQHALRLCGLNVLANNFKLIKEE